VANAVDHAVERRVLLVEIVRIHQALSEGTRLGAAGGDRPVHPAVIAGPSSSMKLRLDFANQPTAQSPPRLCAAARAELRSGGGVVAAIDRAVRKFIEHRAHQAIALRIHAGDSVQKVGVARPVKSTSRGVGF
jgi:hypothetical protein